MTTTVIADTSALLAAFEHNIDIASELERLLGKVRIVVPSCVIRELKGLARKKKGASAALSLIEHLKLDVVEVKGKGDDAILELASEQRYPVLTNDGRLREGLRKRSITVIFMRGLAKLQVEGVGG